MRYQAPLPRRGSISRHRLETSIAATLSPWFAASSYGSGNADMSEKKLPQDSKCFSPLTARIASFYQGFLHFRGERRTKHAVHPVVHPRVHLRGSSNSRNEKNFDRQRCESWARSTRRSGLERPRFFAACAPKRAFGVVPLTCLTHAT
jgi:hypothetical protein